MGKGPLSVYSKAPLTPRKFMTPSEDSVLNPTMLQVVHPLWWNVDRSFHFSLPHRVCWLWPGMIFPGEQAPLEPWLHFLPSLRIPAKCAIYRLAVLSIPSSQSSDWARLLPSCWALRRSSRSSLSASCCACCTRTGWASRPTAGTGQPGTRTSPCTQGSAALGGWKFCTWTSPAPSSWAVLASHTCLQKKSCCGASDTLEGKIWGMRCLQRTRIWCIPGWLNTAQFRHMERWQVNKILQTHQ